MKLPIKVNGKTLYMDFDDYKREQEWRKERERCWPKASIKPFKSRRK